MNNTTFLGKGVAFPFELDSSGGIKFSQFEKSVEESMYIILSTKMGERIMNPEFGCQINELVFEDNTPETHALAEQYVKSALRKWENRIVLLNVNVDSPELNKIVIEIEYQIKDTNSFYNYVYPFYLIETP
ncbi:MAG: GPW/gp25 family protein [Campylobacterota bacterium]|nr:GPW/gp25 family protein [Campylobacterota bacterium]